MTEKRKLWSFPHDVDEDMVDVMYLKDFERGWFYSLRNQLWRNGCISLPLHIELLAKICNCTPKKIKNYINNIMHLFEEETINNEVHFFHKRDREKYEKARGISDVRSVSAKMKYANAEQKLPQLELKSEQEPQLQLEKIYNGNEPRFDKSIWNSAWLIFTKKFNELPHKRGSIKKACINYLLSKDDPNIKIPSIEELFIFYNNHQKQFADQPKYITSLDRYIDDCKWLEDTSFEIKQSLKEKSEADFQEEQDRKDWEFAKRMKRWLPAISSERIRRCERKFGSITD